MKVFIPKPWRSNRHTYAYIHLPPARRTIGVMGIRYFLSFPDILMRVFYCPYKEENCFKFASAAIAFTDSKLDKIFYPKLLNISLDYSICMPEDNINYDSIENLIENVVSSFWNSEFTDDISDCIEIQSDTDEELADMTDEELGKYFPEFVVKMYSDWQAKTKTDSKWIPSIEFLEIGDSVYPEIMFPTEIRKQLLNQEKRFSYGEKT